MVSVTESQYSTAFDREIGSGISETSKRIPIYPMHPERQASEFQFLTEELGLNPRGPGRLRSGSLQTDMSLIV